MIVADFRTTSVPTNIFESCHLFRIDQDLHSFIVETIWLAKIEHVESGLNWLVVVASEEIPLSVATCVHIVLKEQVILILVDFGRCCQVSGFKTALKDQSVVIRIFLGVKGLYVDLDERFFLWIFIFSLLILGNLRIFEELFDVEQVFFDHSVSLLLLIDVLKVDCMALIY